MKNRNNDAILGIVFFGALIGLGVMTIVLSDFALGAETFRVKVYATDIGYLRAGDPILLHGMAAGKVEEINRLPQPLLIAEPHDSSGASPGEANCTVEVQLKMEVDPYLYLRQDYDILIEDLGLLGGKMVRMVVGRADVFIPKGQQLYALAPPSAVQAASEILEENRADIRDAIAQINEFAEKANRGEGTLGLLMNDAETRARIEGIIDDITTVGDSLTNGEGTMGKLLNDSAPFDDLKVAMADARSFTDRIRKGEGTVGKMIQDDTIYEDIRSLTEEARTGLSGIWDGEGTLGKLINDDALYAQAEEFMADLLEIAEKVSDGEGTLGRLLNDAQLYDDVVAFVNDARVVFSDLRDGKGLVAALINDEELLDDFRSILSQVLGAIEDARETTPVTSLGSFLFGTF